MLRPYEESAGVRKRNAKPLTKDEPEDPEWDPPRHSITTTEDHEERLEELEKYNLEYRQYVENLWRLVEKLKCDFKKAQSAIAKQNQTIQDLQARLDTKDSLAAATKDIAGIRDDVPTSLDSDDGLAATESSETATVDRESPCHIPTEPKH